MRQSRTINACLALLFVATARAEGQGTQWIATPSLRAGTSDGPGALTTVFDVEIGRNGEILAGQPSIGTIAVFGADGRYLRSVGRRGQGPGEFQVLGRMGWLSDSLWVVDFGRLHIFNSELEYVRTIAFPTLRPPSGVRRLLPGPLLADGSILGIPMMVEPDREAPVVTLSSNGEIIDSIAHVFMRDSFLQITVPGGDRPGNAIQPWMDNPLWVSTPDGRSVVVVRRPLASQARGSSFHILRIDLKGDTLLDQQVDYVPVERTKAETDQWYASAASRLATQLTVEPAAAERAIRRAVEPPRFHLTVTGFVVSSDGSIWLRREDLGRPDVDWHVFDQSGRLLGHVSLPTGFDMKRARLDRVWGVELDQDDVPFVRVYDIREGR